MASRRMQQTKPIPQKASTHRETSGASRRLRVSMDPGYPSPDGTNRSASAGSASALMEPHDRAGLRGADLHEIAQAIGKPDAESRGLVQLRPHSAHKGL